MASRVLRIVDGESGSAARMLVNLGFNCFSWQPALADGPREMLWAEEGYEAGDKRPSGGGTPLLFPFPGRIGGAAYTFQGREYRLEPGDPFGNAIHGFVYNRPWRVVEQGADRVVGEFQASVDDDSILQSWPADFRIRVAYQVSGRALSCHVRYENTGDGPLPCGFGTHAYFRLPLAAESSAADTLVQVPVCRFWEAEQMLPTGRLLPLPTTQPLAAGMRLGEHRFDTVFTGIQPDANGRVSTRLVDPSSGRSLTQTFDAVFTQCVVYTPDHREAICIEPYTCAPDALRLSQQGHEAGLQILAPGESLETAVRLEVRE